MPTLLKYAEVRFQHWVLTDSGAEGEVLDHPDAYRHKVWSESWEEKQMAMGQTSKKALEEDSPKRQAALHVRTTTTLALWPCILTKKF